MKEICKTYICTGCSLCAVRCPVKCISMSPGKLGHLYPVISQDKCVDCKLCQRGCPSLNVVEGRYPLQAYAAWAKDVEDYKSSTSGGAASVLSQYILEQNGVVYGCSVLHDIKIQHVRITSKEELYKLKGSKYVQSSIEGILPSVKDDVAEGRKVLFIGTPCQIAAVKRLLPKDPKNLYLVDIICHGTPSNKFLIDYIEKKKIKRQDVTSVQFRTPDAFSLIVCNNKSVLYRSPNLWTNRYEDLYYNTFIDGYTYRDSCFKCFYACSERISDITIGDFWGLGTETDVKEIPEHSYGCSVMLPITDKGTELLKAIRDKVNIYERPVTEAINGNEQLRHPKKKDRRIEFFDKIEPYIGASAAYNLLNTDRIIKYKLRKRIRK